MTTSCGWPLLIATARRFPLTPLAYRLIFLHALILIVGAHWTYARVPLVLGPDGRRLAKRHGDVTLREVSPADALAWMGASLGLTGATPREMLDAFDVASVSREPTTYG